MQLPVNGCCIGSEDTREIPEKTGRETDATRVSSSTCREERKDQRLNCVVCVGIVP